MHGGINESFYQVGTDRWGGLAMQENQFREAMTEAGLEIRSWYQIKRPDCYPDSESDYEGCFIVVAPSLYRVRQPFRPEGVTSRLTTLLSTWTGHWWTGPGVTRCTTPTVNRSAVLSVKAKLVSRPQIAGEGILFMEGPIGVRLEYINSVHEKYHPVKKFHSGADYDKLFDPEVYLNSLYSDFIEGAPTATETTEVIDYFHKLYSTGNIKGQRLLDVGTGPSLINLISASRCFEEIYLSDFSTANRNALKQWWNKEENDKWSWESFFRHVAKLEGNEDEWKSLQDEFRSRLKDIYFCDVNNPNPLSPLETEPFDTITSGYCLEFACLSERSYRQAMKNMTSLLKPGGNFIMHGGINESFYQVGTDRWGGLAMHENQFRDAMTEAGLEIKSWYQIKRPENISDCESDYEGCFIVVAMKNSDC
ncbi:indolethylamine N-methyltransferase-like [Lingula anatina]|uniref:Indolethylamine N-methyltransferase-like n=1 Tax=Lingula anatina TaxID=7574 RepID=A0A1S3H736_LINAN|nr:indolethylamine N-methyltransferase-like [Lingula anatina]|eukprot:XP_013381935.1 indolethylamine N-methyltransferase-like [Lingula anatina]